ncbi:MAG: cyclase family protein [Saprospiraceae bacterium]|nr:cyclase family protein [Lewinella sp.]
MKQIYPLLLILLSLGCKTTTEETATGFPTGRWIDLTHDFDENAVFWPTAESFHLDTVFAGMTPGNYYYSAYQFCLAEHGGTHLDAPVHFSEGKWSVDEIPLERGIGEAIVVDVSAKADGHPDYQISVADIETWEAANGPMPEDAILLIRTGYGKFWPDRVAYMGTDERGQEAVAKLHFPGLDPALATWLIENRNVKAVGLDTPSIDYGQSQLFESHRILYGQNILGFENLANLEELPARGAWVIALPMKIKGGSGGPLRMVALLPEG